MTEIVCIDSNVVLDIIIQDNSNYEHLKPLLRRADKGEAFLVVSSLARVEVLHLSELSSDMSQKEQNQKIEGWFNQDYIYEVAAERQLCDRAANLRRYIALNTDEYTLTQVDSIMLATAIHMGVDAFLTTDDGKSAKKNQNGRKAIGLLNFHEHYSGEHGGMPKICSPVDYEDQAELDLD